MLVRVVITSSTETAANSNTLFSNSRSSACKPVDSVEVAIISCNSWGVTGR